MGLGVLGCGRRLVFLTHCLDQLDKPAVYRVFRELMFSVAPAYSNLKRFAGLRRLLNGNIIAYDSGGFQFLTGRLGRPDPRRTVDVYKALGFTGRDFLIQLDLPPRPDMPPEERRRLIVRSAEFFHVMRGELPNVLGVVHGWSREELEYSLSLLEDPDRIGLGSYFSQTYAHGYLQRVAVGSYTVTTVATHSGSAEGVLFRVKRRVIFERLVTAMNLLRNRDVFLLGASNPNTFHLAFLLGARYADGSTWRLAAKMHVIFLPEKGRYSIGKKRVNKRLKDPDLLKRYWKDSLFSDIPFEEWFSILKSGGRRGFEARALWNAWVMKCEEAIANEYVNDYDGYLKYLEKRWRDNSYWRSILRFVDRRVKSPYVREDLTVFLREG